MSWEMIRLGEVSQYVRGVTYKPTDVVVEGSGVACLRTKNIQSTLDLSDLIFVRSDVRHRSDQRVRQNDVLISSANSWHLVGRAVQAGEDAVGMLIGGFIGGLRFDSNRIDPRYGYRWFSSSAVQERIRSLGQQTTNIANLNVDRMLRLPLPLPPLPEQRRIAAILDQADQLRLHQRRRTVLLKTLRSSIFLEMFGRPGNNPKNWDTRRFSGVMTDVTSKSGKVPTSGFGQFGRWPIIDQSRRAVAGFTDDDAAVTHPGDGVVVFGDHTRAVKLVKAPFVLGADGAKILSPAFGVTAEYLAGLLLHAEIPDLGYSRHMRVVKEMTFPVPPFESQLEYMRRVETLDAYGGTEARADSKLDALFASLQHRAFRGEL